MRRIVNWHVKCINDIKVEQNTALNSSDMRKTVDQNFEPTSNSNLHFSKNTEPGKIPHNISALDSIKPNSNSEPLEVHFNDKITLSSPGTIPKATGYQNTSPHLDDPIFRSMANNTLNVANPEVLIDQHRNFRKPSVTNGYHGNQSTNINPSLENLFNNSAGNRASNSPVQDYRLRQRWNLNYDGSPNKNIRDFIFRLESLAQDDLYPLQNLTRIVHMFLSDKATDWFWVFKQNNPCTSWEDMRAAMIAYFILCDSEEETREQIVKRVQGSRELF